MGISFISQTPIAILAAIPLTVTIALIFHRMVKNPKLGIYAVILTAPFVTSLGGSDLMKRFTISEVAGLFLFSAWFLNQSFLPERSYNRGASCTSVVWLLVSVISLSVLINLSHYRNHLQWIVELMVVIYLVVLYMLFQQLIRNDRDVCTVVNVWSAVVGVVVIIGLWDFASRFWDIPTFLVPRQDYRTVATFRKTGQLGVYLLTSFWIVLASLFRIGISRKHRFALILLIFCISILFIAASRRSTFAGLLVGAGVMTLLNLRNAKHFAAWSAIVFCILFIGAVILLMHKDLLSYSQSRVSVLNPHNIEQKAPSVLVHLRRIRSAFSDSPIFGVGWGRVQYSEYSSTSKEIHSAPGQILAECGILGFLAYAFFMGMLMRIAYENAFKYRTSEWSQFSKVIFAGLFALYTSAIYNRHLRERSFWILVALIVCINSIVRQQSQESSIESTTDR